MSASMPSSPTSKKKQPSCTPCNLTFETRAALEDHLFSDEHQDLLLNLDSQEGARATDGLAEFCPLCQVMVAGEYEREVNWQIHCTTVQHMQQLHTQTFGDPEDYHMRDFWVTDSPPRIPVSSLPNAQDRLGAPPNLFGNPIATTANPNPGSNPPKAPDAMVEDEIECPICNASYAVQDTQDHLYGMYHRDAVDAKAHEAHVERILNRIRVTDEEGGISFGEFSSESAEAGKSRCIRLAIKPGAPNLLLTSISSKSKFSDGLVSFLI